jgi:hypothetical protein
MKTIKNYNKIAVLFLMSFFIGSNVFAQEAIDSTMSTEMSDTTSLEDKKDSDTTRISWGKSKILIIGGLEGEKAPDSTKKKQRYNHYAGIDIGVNGFINPDMGMNLQDDAEFLDLDYGKSISVAFNLWEAYIPIAKEKFGIMTGLGFEFNNYALDNDVDISTTKDTTFGVLAVGKSIDKNEFKTTMLNMPLMLETNIGRDAKHSFHLAAGALFSYRLGSKTKQKYSANGKDFKEKNRNDYNLNPFRASLAARIGYGRYTLFANYSLTEMFEKNDGPEIYPFTVGISLATF